MPRELPEIEPCCEECGTVLEDYEVGLCDFYAQQIFSEQAENEDEADEEEP